MNGRKTALVILLFLLIAGMVSAATIRSKNFEVDLSGTNPKITQQYDLTFVDTPDRIAFNAAQSVNTLESWRTYHADISPQFGQLKNVFDATFSFDSTRNVLEMRYELDESLSQKIQEDPRNELWVVNTALFESFQNGATIQVPRNTEIEIVLPFNAEVLPIQNPQLSVNRNVVTVSPLITSNLEIQFRIPKPIAPTFNTEFFQNLLRQPFWQALVGAGIVLMGLGYWQRKRILSRVEEYLVSHSEFSTGKDDEDR